MDIPCGSGEGSVPVYSYLNHCNRKIQTVHMTVDRDGRERRKSSLYSRMYLSGICLDLTVSDASSMTGGISDRGNASWSRQGFRQEMRSQPLTELEVADGEAYDAYIQEHPLSDEPVEITYERDGLDYDGTDHATGNTAPRYLGFSYNAGLSEDKRA